MSEEDYLYQFSILDPYKVRCIGTLPTSFFPFFLAPLNEVQVELLYYPGIGVGVGGGGSVSKKCNVKVFYVMGKASYSVPVTGLAFSKRDNPCSLFTSMYEVAPSKRGML